MLFVPTPSKEPGTQDKRWMRTCRLPLTPNLPHFHLNVECWLGYIIIFPYGKLFLANVQLFSPIFMHFLLLSKLGQL